MANQSPSGLGPRILVIGLVLAAVALGGVSTVAFIQTRQELRQAQFSRLSADRWRPEPAPMVPMPRTLAVDNGTPELQRLRVENAQLKNETAQLRAQLRAMENMRSTVRTFSSSTRTLNASNPRAVGPEKAPRNKDEEERFLAENKGKPGIVTLPSGLQYKVIWPGFGRSPRENELVMLNYRGTLTDGTEIDSSYNRGDAMEFSLTGVIKGWKEALLLMPVGAKWQIFIPSELAYGERGLARRIPANAALIYEMELVSIRERNGMTAPPAFLSGPDGERLIERVGNF